MHDPNKPLEWYIAKLQQGEPFTSLLYGDGEFQAMSGAKTGQAFTNYREVVSQQLVDELRASLDDPDPTIVRGTDLNLIDWRRYGGRDVAQVREVSERAQAVIGDRRIDWVDGTVWDVTVREGALGPLLKEMNAHHRSLMLIASERVFDGVKGFLAVRHLVPVPPTNATLYLDGLEHGAINSASGPKPTSLVAVCMGLGAIPLIMRLRRRYPQATFLDLGSTFDVFAKIGAERGWRRELYADEAAWRALVAKNLERA